MGEGPGGGGSVVVGEDETLLVRCCCCCCSASGERVAVSDGGCLEEFEGGVVVPAGGSLVEALGLCRGDFLFMILVGIKKRGGGERTATGTKKKDDDDGQRRPFVNRAFGIRKRTCEPRENGVCWSRRNSSRVSLLCAAAASRSSTAAIRRHVVFFY